jgi:Capsular polysaccharide biosynthesis protein
MLAFGNVSAENELGFFKSNRLMAQVVEKTGADKSYTASAAHGLRRNELYTQSPVLVTLFDAEPNEALGFKMKVQKGGKVEIYDMYGMVKSNKRLTVTEGDTVDAPVAKLALHSTVFMNPEWIGKEIAFTKSSAQDVAKEFSDALEATIQKGSSLITLSLKDGNAKRAEDILNTLITVYQQDAINDKNQVVLNTAKFLDEHLGVIEGELGGVDTRIESYMDVR